MSGSPSVLVLSALASSAPLVAAAPKRSIVIALTAGGAMRKLFVIVLLSSVACGGKSSPTAPSTPTYPQVSGSYSGNAAITYPELQAQVNCPATTVVTQSGSTVNIAPIVFGGQCAGMSIPFGEVTITTTGSIGSETGTYNEPSCGTYNYSGSGGFFGRELRLSMSATSSSCWNFNITITMSR